MRREDFYTGAVEQSTAPQSAFTTEQEAIQNAGFGQYDYDPAMRAAMNQPVSIYPGGYGYNTQANPAFQFMMNQPQQGMMFGNPWIQQQLAQQQAQMQAQMGQEVQKFIPGLNFSGEYLPSADLEERIEQLKMHYWTKEQEEVGISTAKGNNTYSPFANYFNYYGSPYYNPYSYNYGLMSEMNQKIEELKQEARDNRLSLSMHLSKLCHNYENDNCPDSEIHDMYYGKTVTVGANVGLTYGDIYAQQRFQGLVPFDNAQAYREFDAAVSKEFTDVISEDSNLKETFAKMGIVNANYALEEEKHRRRDGGALYDSTNNAYKAFVREKAAERYNQSQGTSNLKKIVSGLDQLQGGNMQAFPTLNQSAKLCDDGSLTITCPFGSKAGQQYTVHNSQEAAYDQDRERFQQFLDSIPGAVYLDSPNAGD